MYTCICIHVCVHIYEDVYIVCVCVHRGDVNVCTYVCMCKVQFRLQRCRSKQIFNLGIKLLTALAQALPQAAHYLSKVFTNRLGQRVLT